MLEDKWGFDTETRKEFQKMLDEVEEARRVGKRLSKDFNAYSNEQLKESLEYIEALLAVALEHTQNAKEMAKGEESE